MVWSSGRSAGPYLPSVTVTCAPVSSSAKPGSQGSRGNPVNGRHAAVNTGLLLGLFLTRDSEVALQGGAALLRAPGHHLLHVLLCRPPGWTTRPCTGTCCGPAACTGLRRSLPQPWSGTR